MNQLQEGREKQIVTNSDGSDYMDLCQHCHSMTKLLTNGNCGKCGGAKAKVQPPENTPNTKSNEEWEKELFRLASLVGTDAKNPKEKLLDHVHLALTLKDQAHKAEVEAKDDLLDDMWGLICNVNGGFVENERPEWYEAFKRIRTKYFTPLPESDKSN